MLKPRYIKGRRRFHSGRRTVRAHIQWAFRLRQGTPPLPNNLNFNRDSCAEVIFQNPNVLELNRVYGTPAIRFNASRDTIYLDFLSLLCLGHYVNLHVPVHGLRLNGFNQIITLSTPLTQLNHPGIVGLRNNAPVVLVGIVTNSAVLNRTIQPSINTAIAARDTIRNRLGTEYVRRLNEWTVKQRDVIFAEFDKLMNAYDAFY
jgi:hypothetical protein